MHWIFCSYCSVSMWFLRGYSSDHRVETMRRQTRLKVMVPGKNYTHTQIFHDHSVQFVRCCDSASCYWYSISLIAPSKTWTANSSWLPTFVVTGKFVQIQGQMSNVTEFHMLEKLKCRTPADWRIIFPTNFRALFGKAGIVMLKEPSSMFSA